ncbi:MAG: S8 family serine peptidase, partial [Candidatus Thorarchaeota archaeon]
MDKSLFSYFLILIFCLSFGTLTNFHVNEQKNVTSGLSSISDTNNKNIFEKSYQTSSYLSSIRDIVGINQLLNLGYNGSGVTVGIIDSGVNSNLSPFSNRILDSKSFVSTIYGYNTNITSTDDVDDHGTRVASLIMADSIGMAPAANLVSAKLFNGATSAHPGFSGEESSSAVAAAIKWLVDVKNVSIINLSIGQYNNLAREGREYWIDKYSLEKNVIFTISAGNEGYYGYNGGSTGNPAISLQAITVGASGDNSGLAYFSSIGPRYDNAFKPDVVAPGVSVN